LFICDLSSLIPLATQLPPGLASEGEHVVVGSNGRSPATKDRELIEAARQQRRDGNPGAADRILRDAAGRGLIEAMIELALLARDDGRRDESDRWIESAEEALQPGDLDGRIILSGAYSLCLGCGTLFKQQERALELLIEVAQTDRHPRVQEDVALSFLYGLNECHKDEERFEHWIRRAVANGSARAAYIYAKELFRKRRPIPQVLIDMLVPAASENKSAAALLRAITKRTKKPT
jgi:TPR repeat protein